MGIKGEPDNQENFKVYNHLSGRLSKEQLHKHLTNNDLLVLNGADYYRGPLQCAAVFVPPKIMWDLKFAEKFYADNQKTMWQPEQEQIGTLNCFFGKDNFPDELMAWRDSFEDFQNPGLPLRWSAALASMAELSGFTDQELEKTEMEWKQQMNDMVKMVPVLHTETYKADDSRLETNKDQHGNYENVNYADEAAMEEPFNTVTISIKNQQ